MEIIKGAKNGVALTFVLPLTDSASRPDYKAAPTIALGDVKVARYDSAAWVVSNVALARINTITGLTTHLEIELTAAEMTADDDTRPIVVSFIDAAGAQWDADTVEIRLGAIDANLTKIDGLATATQAAVLKLRQVDILNGTGVALVVKSTDNHAVDIESTGASAAGDGVRIKGSNAVGGAAGVRTTGGDGGAGLRTIGGADGGNSNGGGDGVHSSGTQDSGSGGNRSGSGVRTEGAAGAVSNNDGGKGFEAVGAVKAGSGTDGAGIDALGAGTGGPGTKSQGGSAAPGAELLGGASGEGAKVVGGASSGAGALVQSQSASPALAVQSANGIGTLFQAGGNAAGFETDGSGSGAGAEFAGGGTGKDIDADEIDALLSGQTAIAAQNVAIIVDTTQLLVDTAAIIVDTTAIIVDTTALIAALGTPVDLGGGATVGDNLADLAGSSFNSSTDSQEAISDAVATLDTAVGALPDAADNADAVWDEALAGHVGAGSAGKTLSDVPDADANADGVWEEDITTHTGADKAGQKLADNLTDADFVDYSFERDVQSRHADQKPASYFAGTGAHKKTIAVTQDVNENTETESVV